MPKLNKLPTIIEGFDGEEQEESGWAALSVAIPSHITPIKATEELSPVSTSHRFSPPAAEIQTESDITAAPEAKHSLPPVNSIEQSTSLFYTTERDSRMVKQDYACDYAERAKPWNRRLDGTIALPRYTQECYF